MEKILSSLVSEKFANKYCVYPVNISETELVVQMEKFNIDVVNTLKAMSNREVIIEKKSGSEIRRNIKEGYKSNLNNSKKEVSETMDELIEKAADFNASDIHLEPFSSELRVRFRINGDLVAIDRFSITEYSELNTVIKLNSGCDITEKRIPQDGRFTYKKNKYLLDIRLSTIPTVYGEKIVMRLLNRSNFIRSRKTLGFSDKAINTIDKIIENKNGIIIISGTTGSGKSSTVYSLIQELKSKDINITTIEDPVEYKMEGINQIQVNYKSGLKFDNGLRAILRQDPDCIVLGEIRDSETAQIAFRAAITGHLVITTLHTNDALSSIVRLLDIGIDSYLINAALLGVISQRLVKKKMIVKGDSEEERTLIYEILSMNDEIRDCIKNNGSIESMKKIALKSGMITYEESIEEKNNG
ncbi:GspE/PulE family protein [Peptostreptococcus faecalis]|uniref:GspE/PulE family protein n=1 Tax=Peptostreptococcus faecalis TaxID=2045015 RepID=UPI000C7DF653|nr:GspE/PulE family protein [Peptostreptococcus faecalis]